MVGSSGGAPSGVSVLEYCAECGAELDELGRWYPSLSVEAGEGVHLFSFCTDGCKDGFEFDPEEWN
jgi:hypothetical protein